MSVSWPGVPNVRSVASVSAQNESRRAKLGGALSGISANTMVETARGYVPARALQVGDQVRTLKGSFAPIRWLGHSSMSKTKNESPIRFPGLTDGQSGALLTPGSLVLVDHPYCEMLTGEAQAVCSADMLAEAGQAETDDTVSPMMVHILLNKTEMIRCGDYWVESLIPEIEQIQRDAPEAADEILQACPRLRSQQGIASYLRDLLVIDQREASVIFSGS
ncbi:Hint domain-containing protein [Aliiroseovarius sp. S253]|uniref:Hint domain-containing protein n=1 Tax=Aliiroseovarius sp. S253 TaxID=3415133 RepID=UPI003C797B21